MSGSDGIDADLDILLEHGFRAQPRTPCKVAVALESVEGETRAKMRVLLDERFDVPSSEVARLFRKWGMDVNYPSVTRHRRRKTNASGCSCP